MFHAHAFARPDPQQPPQSDERDKTNGEESRPPAWLWALLGILLLLALAAAAVCWLRARLRKTDPALLAAQARSAGDAGLILCRAMLAFARRTGQTPLGGEELTALAHRVCVGPLANPTLRISAAG